MQTSIYLENKILAGKGYVDGQPIQVMQLGPLRVQSTLFHSGSHLGKIWNSHQCPSLFHREDTLATGVKNPDPEGPSETVSGGLWCRPLSLPSGFTDSCSLLKGLSLLIGKSK